ncbi:MAG: sensor histidine kinase [Nocardioides sp.]|nr:sensor histidine kinase [Nocardioides sp.]
MRLDSCVEAALGRVRTRVDGHELRAEIESVTVLGDETDLERAALNLLDNAVKFSPAGSVVDVDLTDGLLTVSDRGSGIAEKDASRAFERFWRSPRARALPGSGLGLAIVRDTAERHGGWATLRPRLGGGTVASLYVPPLETTPEDL